MRNNEKVNSQINKEKTHDAERKDTKRERNQAEIRQGQTSIALLTNGHYGKNV